jgi:hypothetical protein
MHSFRCCSQISASRTMSSTSAAPSNAIAFLQAVEHRRTIYALGKESPIPDARIQEIVEFAVKNCPVSPKSAWYRSSEMLTAVRGFSLLSTRNQLAPFLFSARTTTSESSGTSLTHDKELIEWICRVWDIAKKQIKAIVPEDAWPASETRLNGFQGAYGTVLLYEDQSVVKGLQENIPLYAEHFPICESESCANSRFSST